MEKSTVFLCLLYSLSFSSCDDDYSSSPEVITLEMSCVDAWYSGLIPELECITENTAIALIKMSDFDEKRCEITMDRVECDYCNEIETLCRGR